MNKKRIVIGFISILLFLVGLLFMAHRSCRTQLIFINQTDEAVGEVTFEFNGGPWQIESVDAGQTVSTFIDHGESGVVVRFRTAEGEELSSTVVGYMTNGMQGSATVVYDGTISTEENIGIFPTCEINFLSQLVTGES